MKKLRIGLVGVGAMGTRIETMAVEQGHSITAMFKANFPFNEENMVKSKDRVDVWIDFSHASVTGKLVSIAAQHNLKVVIGTTGWASELESYKTQVEGTESGIIYASNFSLGMFAFNKILNYASSIMAKLPDYDVTLHETHHSEKADAPSGTAKTLAETILNSYQPAGLKNSIATHVPESGIPDAKKLFVTSSRVGKMVGIHEVTFDSPDDTIHLVHDARSRNGFAHGALLAADWIHDKKGFHSLDDMFNDMLGI